jgi:predicted polyphosphate/ATP-dependent NAD kinase
LHKLGLIINPVAGLGGSVGLKGSDGVEVQRRARALGARPRAGERALQALKPLLPHRPSVTLLTYPGEMGEDAARSAGFSVQTLGEITPGATTAEDTRRAAAALLAAGVELLLFAGGDGTARDVAAAVGLSLPVIGIPTGVKMHSAVFAVTPQAAGELAADFLFGRRRRLHEAEVMDLDEEAYRQGRISPRLYGYLRVPIAGGLMQNKKAPTPASERVQMQAIAWDVAERLAPGERLILGPGTTTRAIAEHLGVPKTLVGVDVIADGERIVADAGERDLLALLADGQPAWIVVSLIGGQGFLFGRGNQQISPKVLRAVGRERILAVSTPAKLNALAGRPLLVDTGDPATDAWLRGYLPVITGYHEQAIYRIA